MAAQDERRDIRYEARYDQRDVCLTEVDQKLICSFAGRGVAWHGRDG
jgi:hypothetical protein